VLDLADPPMIHVTRSRLAEIVVFGRDQHFLTPLVVNAGNDILITSRGSDQVFVSKYSVRDGDQKRTVSTRVDDVIRAVVELGGTYPDVVQALQEAKNTGALASRLEFDALPSAGRLYDRLAQGDQDEKDHGHGGSDAERAKPASPVPDLFSRGTDNSSMMEGGSKSTDKSDDEADSDEKATTKKGFFAKILGRD
jgi:hypothetical protein